MRPSAGFSRAAGDANAAKRSRPPASRDFNWEWNSDRLAADRARYLPHDGAGISTLVLATRLLWRLRA